MHIHTSINYISTSKHTNYRRQYKQNVRQTSAIKHRTHKLSTRISNGTNGVGISGQRIESDQPIMPHLIRYKISTRRSTSTQP